MNKLWFIPNCCDRLVFIAVFYRAKISLKIPQRVQPAFSLQRCYEMFNCDGWFSRGGTRCALGGAGSQRAHESVCGGLTLSLHHLWSLFLPAAHLLRVFDHSLRSETQTRGVQWNDTAGMWCVHMPRASKCVKKRFHSPELFRCHPVRSALASSRRRKRETWFFFSPHSCFGCKCWSLNGWSSTWRSCASTQAGARLRESEARQ